MKKADVFEFFRRLAEDNPSPTTELEYANPYTLLVAVVLSAQATDVGVNIATRPLFEHVRTPEQMVALGEERLRDLSEVLRDSIRAGLGNREEALAYAMQFGRGLTPELADRFVGMYVNELTEDYGEEGRQAVAELLRRGEESGAFERPVRVEFA